MLVFFTIIVCSFLRTIELRQLRQVIEYGEITPLANGSVDIHVHVCSALVMGIKFRVFTFREGFISAGL